MSDAIIHLRVPAATKGRWVRESRAAGMRLTDWITQIMEANMPRKKSCLELSADEGLITHEEARGLAIALSGRGGPGRGQGRKPADGATGLKRRNVSLDDPRADVLRALGDGDLSLGIRRAADRVAET